MVQNKTSHYYNKILFFLYEKIEMKYLVRFKIRMIFRY